MLTYLVYGTGTSVLVGNFLDAALANYKVALPGLWVAVAVAATLIAAVFAYRNMRIATRLMLALEAVSVLAIIVLGVVVLAAASPRGLSTAPFSPAKGFGWSGIGYAMVFAVLSFAGFEGAATLGEEAEHPHTAIPIPVFGTVIIAGIFYVFASYFQVVGFGLANIETARGRQCAAQHARAPLRLTRVRHPARCCRADLGVFLHARLSFGGGENVVRARTGRPRASGRPRARGAWHTLCNVAVSVMAALMILGEVLWAPFRGAANYYGHMGTIGMLALILVYLGVTAAEAIDAGRTSRAHWCTFGAAGAIILLWPLYNSVYPVPAYPGNLWPYLVAAWLAVGGIIVFARPMLATAALGVD